MNDIEQYIPTKEVVSVGPMEQSEAISLLTSGVIDISRVSQEDMNMLDELAQDVHLWPLLLSLVRGQLFHNLKLHTSSYHEAVQFVQANLQDKGLTAFDKNNIERSRKYAVRICIEVTLELLTKSTVHKIKSLIVWNGIGTSLQTAVLHNLWNTTEHEAREVVDVLWAYGLVQFTDIIILPQNNTQHCVEVHAIISQYIVERMDSEEVCGLIPFGGLATSESVGAGLFEQFLRSTGTYSPSLLSDTNYLRYKLSMIEYLKLPFLLKRINMMTIAEPHHSIILLEALQEALISSPNITAFFPTLNDEIDSLITDHHKILKNAHKLSRTLNQNVQRYLAEGNYHSLIQSIETYKNKYPITTVGQKAVNIVQKVIPYCDGELLHYITWGCEHLQMKTHDYHTITLQILPQIQLYTKELQLIYTSLQKGQSDIRAARQYFLSGQHDEASKSIETNCKIKLQEVAPNYVNEQFNKDHQNQKKLY